MGRTRKDERLYASALAWRELADAIADRQDEGEMVVCVTLPKAFSRPVPRGNPNGARQQTLDRCLRAACAQCPVLAECRAYAETGVDVAGFMAGMTRRERHHRMRGERRVANSGDVELAAAGAA